MVEAAVDKEEAEGTREEEETRMRVEEMVEGNKLLVEVVMEERKWKTRSVQRTVVKTEEQLIVCQVQVSSFNEFQTQETH